jgi:phosphopantetheinyl transferase (holo-ACP synthase)
LTSTGNDIVALQLINTERTHKKSFYSKILCSEEVSLYTQINLPGLSFENYIWLLWSVKESVYKFCKRHNPRLLFSPTRIKIQEVSFPVTQQDAGANATQEGFSFLKEDAYCCQVSFNAKTYYGRSFINDELIFSVVNNEDDFQNIYWGIQHIQDDAYVTQAKAVRSLALDKLKKIVSSNNLLITKTTTGYPEVVQHPHIKLSFAHHGKFVAYSLRLN